MRNQTASQTNAGQKLKEVSAVLLDTHLRDNYGGDALSMSKATGIKTTQIKRWLDNDAVIADGSVYLKASKFTEDKKTQAARLDALATGSLATDFNDHLRVNYGGNQSQFAESNEVLQQQVNRWTKRKCLFLMGNVYRMQRSLNENVNATGKKTVH